MRTSTNRTVRLLILLALAVCTGCSSHLAWGSYDNETGGFAYSEAPTYQTDEHTASRALLGEVEYSRGYTTPATLRNRP